MNSNPIKNVITFHKYTRSGRCYGSSEYIQKVKIVPLNINTTSSLNPSNKRKRENIKDVNEIITHLNKKQKTNPIENTFMWDEFNKLQLPQSLNKVYNQWVSPSNIKNHLLDDGLVDWLEKYYEKLGFNEHPSKISTINKIINFKKKYTNNKYTNNNYTNENFKHGNDFERNIIEQFNPEDVKRVVNIGEYVKFGDEDITIKFMLDGVLIIEQAAFYNYKNKTFGIADLLIRSDHINKLFKNQVIPKEMEQFKAPNLNGNYHYVVVDIKWINMPLLGCGRLLKKDGRIPSYKGQLAIYNSALGQLQCYTPQCAYILGKSWSIDSGINKNKCYDDPFERLGVIDFENHDKEYIKLTHDAVYWIRNMRANGNTWSCINPTIYELNPNMCCTLNDNIWKNVKQNLAIINNELTSISGVTYDNRKVAFANGVKSWKDKNCSAKIMGITGKKTATLVDWIIYCNRDSQNLIEPTFIYNTDNDWQIETPFDFYVDFETLYDDNNHLSFLFMIGVWYNQNGTWKYTSFITINTTLKEEYRIVEEFSNFINSITNGCKPKLYCWSNAEKSTIKAINNRHNKNWFDEITWCDIFKLFKEVPIIVKGTMGFGLKCVAKKMIEHEMIKTNWLDNGIENGKTAMDQAKKYYASNNRDESIMKNIRDYNESDCKVVWNIVCYLRNTHIKI